MSPRSGWSWWLVGTALLLAGGFAIEWYRPHLAGGILYLAAVLLALWAPGRRPVVAVTVLGSILALLDHTLPPQAGPLTAEAGIERLAVVSTLWVVAGFHLRHRADRAGQARAAERLAEAERALRQKEPLAHVGELVAVVAHEVRNPLAGLRGALQILAARFPEGASERAVIAEMLQRIDGLDRVVSDLLDYGRPRAPRLEPVALAALFEGVVHDLEADASRLGVTLEADAWPCTLLADRAQLDRAVLNVALNAVQAAPSGGRVQLRARSDGDWCEIAVIDDGDGLSEEAHAHAFEPFFTTRSRGTGLGLPTARRIVEAHGGSLALEPASLRGTVARIRLRRASGAEVGCPTKESAPALRDIPQRAQGTDETTAN